ncbi:hypothetical protein HHFLNI_HHFLNI_03370, partial [Dysosmobacter welbionis]
HVPGLVDDQHLRQHTVVVLPQGAGEDRAGPVDDDPPPVVPLRRRHQQPVPPEAGRKAPIGPAETLQRLPLTGAGGHGVNRVRRHRRDLRAGNAVGRRMAPDDLRQRGSLVRHRPGLIVQQPGGVS